jgi:ABC-2 type transport system ATP-binding protein
MTGPAPAAGDAPALDVRHASHRFGAHTALDDFSLTVPRGRFVALLGPNGAGKTTLFSIVTRLYGSRTGQVRVFGHDLHRQPSKALACVGVVFQPRTIDPDLGVRQNLAYHAALQGMAGRAAGARIDALLARVGLADRAGDKVRSLSGGQVRRLEIARALVHAPRLLLLDEATVGLDVEARRSIGELVRDLVRREDVAALWATHLLDEIEPGDDVAVIDRGRLLARDLAGRIAAEQGDGAFGPAFEAAFRRLTSHSSPMGIRT